MDDEIKRLAKSACKRLTGFERRSYQAEITIKYFNKSSRKAETEMGWGRESVEKGLKEAESGIRCADNFHGRGGKRTEDTVPGLKEAVISLAERETQADPAVKSALTYTRITGKSVRKALIEEKGFSDGELPAEKTFCAVLNRMGYNLKRVQKAKPRKKTKEVDVIFTNVWKINRESDLNPESLRISVDAKAKVNIGDFSRNGKSRGKEAKKAGDHDMNPAAWLVPYGILNVLSGLLTIFFGTSYETSDFIADCIEEWQKQSKNQYSHIKEIGYQFG